MLLCFRKVALDFSYAINYISKIPAGLFMDAKEWSKIAENMVKTRWYLYQIMIDEEIDTNIKDKIMVIRYLLMIALEELDKVADYDAKGWL